IKAGGSKGVSRDDVADLVAQVSRQDEIVLVHGASAETDRIAAALGVPQEQITSPSGHVSRRTDRRTLEIFAMAALGVENFQYVEKLQQRSIDAAALIIRTNVPGLLRDVDDPSSLVAETTLDEAERLAQGRMKKKILAAREALEAGIDEVVIRSASGAPSIRTVIRA